MRPAEQVKRDPEATDHREMTTSGVTVSTSGKRFLDVLGAVVGLTLSLPLMALIAVFIRLESSGQVFYRQRRVGRNGASFEMLKFRTMRQGADELGSRLERDPEAAHYWNRYQKLYEDPRITRTGRLLRRWSLDELPQLLNVLRGEMSLIGPRPILPEQRSMYGPLIREYSQTRPGLTGLWQVSGRNQLSFADRIALDRTYLTRQTLRLDLTILMRTVVVVFRGDGAY